MLFPPERIVLAGFRSKIDLFRRDIVFQSLSYRYTSDICLISSGRVPAEMQKILPLTSAEEPGSLGCGQHDRACSPQRPVQKAIGLDNIGYKPCLTSNKQHSDKISLSRAATIKR